MHRAWQKKKKFFIPFFYLPECDPKEKRLRKKNEHKVKHWLIDDWLVGLVLFGTSVCVCVCGTKKKEKTFFFYV